MNIQKHIQFSTKILNSGEIYNIKGIEIISVVVGSVQDKKKGKLKVFESSVYYAGTIEAIEKTMITIVKVDNPEIILNNIDVNKNFGEYIRNSWSQLRQLYDVEGFEKVDLYRSDQEDVEFLGINYKFNFWFCGEMTNCRIHNQHTFIEFHTCIAGDGFMQKFEVNDVNTLIETVGLMPGASHRTFNMEGENEENGNPKYPFHRWLGGKTGNIWLVIEKY